MLPLHIVDAKQVILRLECWSVELFQDLFNNPLEHNPDPPPTVYKEISLFRCRKFLLQQYAWAFLELWLKKTNSMSLSGRWNQFESTPICGFYTFLSNTCEAVTLERIRQESTTLPWPKVENTYSSNCAIANCPKWQDFSKFQVPDTRVSPHAAIEIQRQNLAVRTKWSGKYQYIITSRWFLSVFLGDES